MFYSLSAVSLLTRTGTAKDEIKIQQISAIIIFGFMFWVSIGVVCTTIYTSSNAQLQAAALFGLCSSVFSIAYYSAPLTTAVQVIRSQDASSLYAPMIVVNFFNAVLWVIYGYVAIDQFAVWVPNLVGAVLAAFQLSIIAAFYCIGKKGAVTPPASSGSAKPSPLGSASSSTSFPSTSSSQLLSA